MAGPDLSLFMQCHFIPFWITGPKNSARLIVVVFFKTYVYNKNSHVK